MLNYLPALIHNPLIIAGILMALAIAIYFSLEYRHMLHKTKIERAAILLGLGFFLVAISLISLFTTSLNILANSAGLTPPELRGGLYTLDEVDKLCNQFIADQKSLTPEYMNGCSAVHYVYYGAYAVLVIALTLLIAGFFKRVKSVKEEKSKPKTYKYCVECGEEIAKEAKNCSGCGKKQGAD